jgi:hypothetical protein
MRMINIKFKDTSKLIMAICSSMLKEENKTLIVSPDEEKSKEAILETNKLLQQGSLVGLDTYSSDNRIVFKNGSTIEFVVPEKESDTIRGKRSKLPMWLYDYEYYDKEEVDKGLEPFINNRIE